MRKLGLIAGGGALPISLVRHCQATGRPVFVVRLKRFADPELAAFEGADVGIAELGKGIAALKGAACEAVCLAGYVDRPDFRALKPDLRGLAALPGAIRAAREGDGGLLAFLVGEFEGEGFVVEGADEVMADLILPPGPLGRHAPASEDRRDIERAMRVARAIGDLDVGQGAVCCDGQILAVEAQEGTDAMLRRIADLPRSLRGVPGSPRGVLAKACKPGQDSRVDLPTIGPSTVRNVAAAGLRGIAGEAGRALVVDRAAVIAAADAAGIFVMGLAPEAA